MTDATSPDTPATEPAESIAKPRKRYYDGQPLPEGERSAIESILTEHGVARIMDEIAQLCDDIARRPNTSPRDYHVFSLLSMHLGDHIGFAEKIEKLQEGG